MVPFIVHSRIFSIYESKQKHDMRSLKNIYVLNMNEIITNQMYMYSLYTNKKHL